MAISPLNYDVLDVVFSFVPAEQALRFSTVSSAIYHIALRRALTSVRLKTNQKTLQFCAFALSSGAMRISLLRGLELLEGAFKVRRPVDYQHGVSFPVDMDEDGNVSDGHYDFSLATILASILRQAHGLTYLHISGAETVLQGSPFLGEVIAGLQNLRKLELENVGVRTQALLRRLRCDVRDLGLKFGTCALRDVSGFRNLESLHLFRIRVFSSCGGGSESSPVDPLCWPSVRTIRVGYVTASLATFVDAFPNVRVLDTSEVVEPPEQLGSHENHGGSSWGTLDHLIVCIGDRQRRWRTANIVTTHKLSVVNSISPLPPASSATSNQEEALEVVRDTAPTALSLSLSTEVDGQFWTKLAEAGSRLRYMEIKLLAARGTPAIESWMVSHNLLYLLTPY